MPTYREIHDWWPLQNSLVVTAIRNGLEGDLYVHVMDVVLNRHTYVKCV